MRYGTLASRTSSGTTGTAAWELIAGTVGCRVKQIQVTLAAATASTYGLGKPAAVGITPTSPVQFLDARGGAYPLLSKAALAWGTGPTLPAQFMRRVGFPNVITSSILWVFENELYIPAGGSIVLWNLGTNGVVDISADISE